VTLSRKARQAIKVALAMPLTQGIALQFGYAIHPFAGALRKREKSRMRSAPAG